MSAVRSAYRTLLRAVDRRVTAVSGSPLWRDGVRQAFRETHPADAAALEAALTRAEDLTFYVESVTAHRDLLVSYGISIDKEAGTAEQVARTAKRVGLTVGQWDETGKLRVAPAPETAGS